MPAVKRLGRPRETELRSVLDARDDLLWPIQGGPRHLALDIYVHHNLHGQRGVLSGDGVEATLIN
jgi:hypothetical protein